MNIHDKGFDRANQELIDRYVDRLKYKSHLLDDDSLRSFKPAYRKSSFPEWIGRNMYYPFHRYDVMYYSKKDIKMTKIRRMNIINFNIIDMKFERMIIEHGSIMNGMFKNTEFFRFCLDGKPGFYDGENEYHKYRNVVMNCKFINCVFMNSYSLISRWNDYASTEIFLAHEGESGLPVIEKRSVHIDDIGLGIHECTLTPIEFILFNQRDYELGLYDGPRYKHKLKELRKDYDFRYITDEKAKANAASIEEPEDAESLGFSFE